MSLVESLNKKLTENFGKDIVDFNKNVYPAAKLPNGKYEAPVIAIGAGGGTILTGDGEQVLDNPAPVSVKMNEVDAYGIVYRLTISRSEAEIADKNPAYFSYFFKTVLEKALANYQGTVGGPDALRFGSHYVKVSLSEMSLEPARAGEKPYTIPDVEAAIPSPVKDTSGLLELRLDGDWAKV